MNMHQQEALHWSYLPYRYKTKTFIHQTQIVSYLLCYGVKFLFLDTSHVPLIHTVAQRRSETQLERFSLQNWQAYLKATPI